MSDLAFSIKLDDLPGYVSWRISEDSTFTWVNVITDDLLPKIQEKVKQLKEYSRNLVFVGLNHSSPCDGIFPRIFKDIGNSDIFSHEAQKIRNYWESQMRNLPNIIGICYFIYSLERETPFYPLKIFWRSEVDKIMINL